LIDKKDDLWFFSDDLQGKVDDTLDRVKKIKEIIDDPPMDLEDDFYKEMWDSFGP